jgi:uncharacterized SAM-binding protein YcdF (DUF218 family)
LWDYHRLDQPIAPKDVIIGLGSYDLRVADHCAALFNAGIAPALVFTGHCGHWTEGLFERSEAAAFAARAVALGVPQTVILIEESARNIGENIAFTAPLVAQDARVLFVTKPQTQRRCFATAMKQWPGDGDLAARLSVMAPPTRFEDQPTPDYPLDRLIDEMVGDLWRILDYPARGFQIPQTVPEEVLAAYEQLRRHGYDRHIPR